MAIYRLSDNKEEMSAIRKTSFVEEDIKEDPDLRLILRAQPEVLEEGLFILSEEFSRWQGSGRSIDLLAIDSTGRLVVVEVKRTRTADHAELQAIRYAAMVSSLTFEQAVETHDEYIRKWNIEGDAKERINEHFENPAFLEFSTGRPRILLVSEGFSTEITTTVLWLNENYEMDIKCLSLQPHKHVKDILVETNQIIPLPEASEYMTRIRNKEEELIKGPSPTPSQFFPGDEVFQRSIANAEPKFRAQLVRLHQWAAKLKDEGLATLESVVANTQTSLGVLVAISKGRVRPLMIVNRTDGGAYLWLYNTVLSKQAPSQMNEIYALKAEASLSENASRISEPSDHFLDVLTEAYREANGLLTSEGEPEA